MSHPIMAGLGELDDSTIAIALDVPYTLYINVTDGDCTVTDGEGRYFSFFFGRGRWLMMGAMDRSIAVNSWVGFLGRRFGDAFHPADRAAILEAVLAEHPA